MVCRNCGNEMRDDARFCPHCGAAANPDLGGGLPQGAAPYGASATPAWEDPGSGGKKKTGLFIGVGVAVVAVIALAAVLVGGLFGSPKGTVEKAFLKSYAAYEAAEKKLGLPDMERWQKDQTVHQNMSLELKGINSALVGYDLSALNGLGLFMETDYSGKDRLLSFGLGAYWGEDDLLSLQVAADDAELYFSFPQFLGETFYGMNTETLGADLAELTGDNSVKDMSFNLFDMVDMVLEKVDQEAMEQDLKDANKALWEAAQVKKSGAMTLDINGTSTKTTAYRVTIPQEALDQYVDDLTDILSAMNYYDLYEEIYQSMGMPQDQIDEILSALEAFDVYGDLADVLHDGVADIGDLELDVCLSDGYVSALLYEGRIDGSDVEVSVCLGGGEEYVDDVSLNIETPSVKIEAKSTGDHGLKNGIYIDETTVRVRQGDSTLAHVTSELSLDPSKEADNFRWKLGVDSSGLSVFVLETEGDVEISESRLSAALDEVSVRAMGVEICTLGFSYYADCHPSMTPIDSPRMIADMSQQEIEQLNRDVEANAAAWLSQMQWLLMTRLPSDLLWAIMGGF